MGRSEVDAVLARLVDQFASPYDFLRELVQNSMDAGADRLDVSLELHEDAAGLAPGAAVIELSILDTGSGMDEAVIDGALTRLFSSSKADDRTMAGGFGVGFVSIFAWEPQAVLLQTGRGGEAWELIFHEDRRFEKHRLDMPVEGTTITMLRTADAGVYPAVVEAVRDSLWRWCRFCPLEITFEDLSGDLGPELIQDAPAREEQVLAHAEVVGDGEVRVAFGVPSHATLLRRGLILAEGAPGTLVASLANAGRSADHLQLWIDSPDLETTLARDKVVKSSGREGLEAKVDSALAQLRRDLLDEITKLASVPGEFSATLAARWGTLHAHLQLEWEALGDQATRAPLVRLARASPKGLEAEPRAISLRKLVPALEGGPLLYLAMLGEDEQATAPATQAALLDALAPYPVVLVRADEDGLWLREFAARANLKVHSLARVAGGLMLADAKPAAALQGDSQLEPEPGVRLLERTQRVLRDLVPLAEGQPFQGELHLAFALQTDAYEHDPPLCAWSPRAPASTFAMTSRAGLPISALGALWLDERHLLVRAAVRAYERAPRAAVASLCSAILSVVELELAPKLLAERLEQEEGAW